MCRSDNSKLLPVGVWRRRRRWGSLIERAVGAVSVVVVDVVVHEPLELVLVPDGGAVEQLAAQTADPALGEGVGCGCPNRGLENLEALGAEDLVEVVYELAGAVTNEGSAVGEPPGMAHEEVARRLGGPGRRSGGR